MTTLADDLPQFGAERRQVRDLQGQNIPDETFAIGELEERFSMWRRGVHLLGQAAEGDAALTQAGDDAEQIGRDRPSRSNFQNTRQSPSQFIQRGRRLLCPRRGADYRRLQRSEHPAARPSSGGRRPTKRACSRPADLRT
jgi:hypothetical protein